MSGNCVPEYQQHAVTLAGRRYLVYDTINSNAVSIIEDELRRDAYQLAHLELMPGDVVVDIGGHIGMFAIYAATRWPGISIHSFEPFATNAAFFEMNVAKSGLSGITLHRYAIAGKEQLLRLVPHERNSGGVTGFTNRSQAASVDVPAYSLDFAFEREGIVECALLKIDCEGAEYDVLNSTNVLGRVKHLRGELHTSGYLEQLGHHPRNAVRRCLMWLPKESIRFNICVIDS